jgi:hypothetical protein
LSADDASTETTLSTMQTPGFVFWYLERAIGAKLKGVATVKLANGRIRTVELHWYEAHGVGKRKIKIKGFLDLTS